MYVYTHNFHICIQFSYIQPFGFHYARPHLRLFIFLSTFFRLLGTQSLNCGSRSFHVEKAAVVTRVMCCRKLKKIAPPTHKTAKKNGFFHKGNKNGWFKPLFPLTKGSVAFSPSFWKKNGDLFWRFSINSFVAVEKKPIARGLTNQPGEVNGCVKGRLRGNIYISPPTRQELL